MAATRIRVGLLGCGRIAHIFHLPILADLEGVELVAVAEPDPVGRRRAVAGAPRASVVEDWREVVADPGIDAVVVCLPSDMHADAACAAFAAGRHVYLEKPIATTLEDGRRVLGAWRSSGTVGMAGFDQRFEPSMVALRREVVAGRVGVLTGARLVMGSGRSDTPEWKRARATGGGVLLDLGSHMADLTRFVFGREIHEVRASIASVLADEDTAAFVMSLAGGPLAAAWVTLAGITESRLEVVGKRGMLVADRYAGTLRFHTRNLAWSRPARARAGLARMARAGRALLQATRPLAFDTTYRNALTAFADATSGGAPVSPDIEDGFRSLAIVLAAEESARTGRAVAPPTS